VTSKYKSLREIPVRNVVGGADPTVNSQTIAEYLIEDGFNPGGGGGGGSGFIYVEDVSVPSGTASNKAYQDAGNNVLQTVTVSGTSIDVDVVSSYPLVRVNGTNGTLTRSGGIYTGTVSTTISGTGDIIAQVIDPDGNAAASDTLGITLDAPPVVLSAVFTGGYPGAQTEVKAGDTYDVYITSDKNFDQVRILDADAGTAEDIVVASSSDATVTVTIADRGVVPTARPVQLQVRDASTGAYSAIYDSSSVGSVDGVNVVTLNNLYPTASFGAVGYPPTQSALKASETASVGITLADQDSAVYSSPNGDLDVASFPTVQRIAGSYNVSVTNLRVTATKDSNGAQAIDNAVINIANVAPTISVSLPAARLQSGGNDGTSAVGHTITLTSDQQLSVAPTLNEDSGGNRGSFSGSWSGGPTVYTRTLTVDEGVPDEKGVFSFEGLVATGLSGLVQNTIDSGENYELGGFVARDLTFAAFATTVNIGTSVEDFSKLTAGEFTATASSSIKQSIGTSPPVVNGYTIDAIQTNPTELEWLDTSAASTNSSGTAQLLDVEETP